MAADSDEASLSAPYTVEFPFQRTVGPKIGVFLGGLRDGRLFGVRTRDGEILCPAFEFDPRTAAPTGELVELGTVGEVQSWTWVPRRDDDVLTTGFAWALIRVDGAVGGLFHAVDTGGNPAAMAAGMRVRVRWSAARVGSIRDIECFEPVPS